MSPSADTSPTAIYTLSLHDALPISRRARRIGIPQGRRAAQPGACERGRRCVPRGALCRPVARGGAAGARGNVPRSEEHTSELQSLRQLVCRLLLEKKKKNLL